MALTIILFILGFVFLIKGADVMVDGSSSIAKKFGISSFVVGLTVVAFGTSAPELTVSILANIKGSAGIALGNIIGSNISNILLILGIAALIRPLVVKKNTVRKEIPLSLLAVLAVGILANDFLIDGVAPNGLTRIDGLMLILLFSIFIYYTFGIAKSEENIFQKTVGQLKQEASELKEKEIVKEFSVSRSLGMIIVGLAGLILGGKWIVEGATLIAQLLGMSEALIGLTIIAVGTSLPELAASAIAAKKGQTDIAVGNVVGSNIFNFLWVLGLSAVIAPIGFSSYLNTDIVILFGINILLLILIYVGKKNILGRAEGVTMILLYALYIVFLIFRG